MQKMINRDEIVIIIFYLNALMFKKNSPDLHHKKYMKTVQENIQVNCRLKEFSC